MLGGAVGGSPRGSAGRCSSRQVRGQATHEVPRSARSNAIRAGRRRAACPKRGRYSYNIALEQDPKAVLQTGPGSPAGPGGATRSRGAGPWAATTRCGSSSSRPGLNRLLTLLRLGLLAAFAYVLLTGRWPRSPAGPSPRPSPRSSLSRSSRTAAGASRRPRAPRCSRS